MLKLSAGLRNLFIISQTNVNNRLCHIGHSVPVRVRFAPSPTGCFDNKILHFNKISYVNLKFKAICIWVVYELPYTITCLPKRITAK